MVRCLRVAAAMLLACGASISFSPFPALGANPLHVSRGLIVVAAQMPDMKSRMRLARADRQFEETKKAGGEIVEIVESLRTRIRDNGSLAPADHKAIDRLKKLAKKIRSDFGGEGLPQFDEVPSTLVGIAEAVGDRAKSIEGHLEKVTRYEVNRNLIVLAGDLIVLSDALKTFGAVR